MKTTGDHSPSTGRATSNESSETQVVPSAVQVRGAGAASSVPGGSTVLQPQASAPEGMLIPKSSALTACPSATPQGLADLSVPSNQDCRDDDSMTLQKNGKAPSCSPTSWLTRGIKQTWSFLVHTARHDWQAAPISFLASFSSNVITAFSVVACAPWCARLTGGEDTPAFTLAISTAAVLIGYCTYLAGYYPMMAYKEKVACRAANKPFSSKEFLRVMVVDFTMHLPNDILTMSKAGAAQFALLASGFSNLFWSVIISQMAIDLLYSPKEAVYWSLSKALVRKSNGDTSDTSADRLHAANQDTVELSDVTKQAGNE